MILVFLFRQKKGVGNASVASVAVGENMAPKPQIAQQPQQPMQQQPMMMSMQQPQQQPMQQQPQQQQPQQMQQNAQSPPSNPNQPRDGE